MMKFRRLLPLLCLCAVLLTLKASAGGEGPAFLGVLYPPDTRLIDFGAQKVEDFEGLKALISQLPALETVNMFESRVPREVMADLFAGFPRVFFGWTIKLSEHSLRTDQTAFSTLHNNKAATHTSADFEVIRYCTRLQALDLGHNQITSLDFLRDLHGLKVLILAVNQISDISALSGLGQLEYVELFKNKISDISVLEGMKNLLDLNLCFNYIKDYGPLFTLTSLQRLWLYNSNNYIARDTLAPALVRDLKAALPGAQIDTTHYSTLGGWREHPRYEVIYNIFKTSVYQPFPAAGQP
ncbi:MAG: leucine-rich repeat domain-containing protein [Christensenellales bacterium]